VGNYACECMHNFPLARKLGVSGYFIPKTRRSVQLLQVIEENLADIFESHGT